MQFAASLYFLIILSTAASAATNEVIVVNHCKIGYETHVQNVHLPMNGDIVSTAFVYGPDHTLVMQFEVQYLYGEIASRIEVSGQGSFAKTEGRLTEGKQHSLTSVTASGEIVNCSTKWK